MQREMHIRFIPYLLSDRMSGRARDKLWCAESSRSTGLRLRTPLSRLHLSGAGIRRKARLEARELHLTDEMLMR